MDDTNVMNTTALVREFGREIGLPDLSLGAEGTLGLTVGEDMEIVLEENADGDAIDVFGVVGPLPSTSGRFLTALLAANYGGGATGGSALAVDPRTGFLTLCRRFATEGATGESLAAEMDRFAKYLSFWKGYAPELAAKEQDGAPFGSDGDMQGLTRP